MSTVPPVPVEGRHGPHAPASGGLRWVRQAVAWSGGNLAMGYLLVWPVIEVINLSYYARATLWNEIVPPYGGLEAFLSAVFVVVVGGGLTTAAAFFNRRQWRRFTACAGPAPVAITAFLLATIVVLALPSLWFAFATDRTIPALLGRGLLW